MASGIKVVRKIKVVVNAKIEVIVNDACTAHRCSWDHGIVAHPGPAVAGARSG